MYIKDTTGGVVNHEITIAPQETYGSFVEQQTFNNVIGIGELETDDKQVKGAINELYNRTLNIDGEDKKILDTELYCNTSLPTDRGRNYIPLWQNNSGKMQWVPYTTGSEQSGPMIKNSYYVPSGYAVSYALPTLNDRHDYTELDKFYSFTTKANDVYKYPMANSQGMPAWVDSETFIGTLLDGIEEKLREKWFPIGTYVMGDNLTSEEVVKQLYGGTTWTKITGAVYGVGDQITSVTTVSEQLPNIYGQFGGARVGVSDRHTATGPFTSQRQEEYAEGGSSGLSYGGTKYTFNANRANSTYKDGGHVFAQGRSTWIWKRTA